MDDIFNVQRKLHVERPTSHGALVDMSMKTYPKSIFTWK